LSVGDSSFSDHWICEMCGHDADMAGAITHARTNPGHVVTEQVSDGDGQGVEVKVPILYGDDGPATGTITRPTPQLQPAQPAEITRS
jgi:hypothetical protein